MPDDVLEIRRIGHKPHTEIKPARPCNRLLRRLWRIQHQNALIGNGIIPPVSQRPATHLDGRPVLHRQNRFDKAAERPHQLIAGKSSVARLLNERRYQAACNAFALWDKVRGRVVQGLANRRADEQKEFFRNG